MKSKCNTIFPNHGMVLYIFSMIWRAFSMKGSFTYPILSRNAASSQTAEGMLYHAFHLVIGHRI
jgi:hypothetical protein